MRVRRLRIPTRRKRSEGTLGARTRAQVQMAAFGPPCSSRSRRRGSYNIASYETMKQWPQRRNVPYHSSRRVKLTGIAWFARFDRPLSTGVSVPRQCFSLRVYRAFGNCRCSRKGIRVPRHETRLDPPGPFSPSSSFRILSLIESPTCELFPIANRVTGRGMGESKILKGKKEEILLRETDQSSNILKNVGSDTRRFLNADLLVILCLLTVYICVSAYSMCREFIH